MSSQQGLIFSSCSSSLSIEHGVDEFIQSLGSQHALMGKENAESRMDRFMLPACIIDECPSQNAMLNFPMKNHSCGYKYSFADTFNMSTFLEGGMLTLLPPQRMMLVNWLHW